MEQSRRNNRKASRKASRNNRKNSRKAERKNRKQRGGAGFFSTRLTGPAAGIVNALDRAAGREIGAIAGTTQDLLHSGLRLVSKTLSYAGEGANNTVRSAVRVVSRKNRNSRKNNRK